MKKKSLLIILLVVFVCLLKFVNNGKGYYYNFISLETDKETYFNDESIKINASWELSYNDSREFSYIQIQIYNISNDLLWNSPQYTDLGYKEESWIINIQDLDILFMNYSKNTLYVKFFLHYLEITSGSEIDTFLKTIEIETIKRNVSYELIGFRNHKEHGENLHFKIRFYNTSLINNSYLIDYIVSFKIIANQIILYKEVFTTDSFGIIEINISSLTNLSVGVNNLIFTISGNNLYNSLTFGFELYVNLLQKESNQKKSKESNDKYSEISIISLISISSLLLVLLLGLYFYNIKGTRQKNLTEVTFKY